MKKFIILTLVFTLIFTSFLLFYEPKSPMHTAARYEAMFAPRTLYWGVQGDDVKLVQDKLLRWGYYDGAVDGIYGARTYRAVRKFQAKNGLQVDGVVGPATARALGMPQAFATAAVLVIIVTLINFSANKIASMVKKLVIGS